MKIQNSSWEGVPHKYAEVVAVLEMKGWNRSFVSLNSVRDRNLFPPQLIHSSRLTYCLKESCAEHLTANTGVSPATGETSTKLKKKHSESAKEL